jgi:putative transcriptional regulator
MKTSPVRFLLLVMVPAVALVMGVAMAATKQKPSQTYFLVAQPDLPDPMFRDSVVLMLPPTGTPLIIGLIVNKPTKLKLTELFPHDSALKNDSDTAFFGGPVDLEQPLELVHTIHAPAGAVQLFKDVYLNLKGDSILSTLKDSQMLPNMRLYLGRAQWSDDQLHDEMLENSWYNVPSDPQFVFSADPTKVWRTLVARAQAIETSTPRPRLHGDPPGLLRVTWPSIVTGLDAAVLDR